MAFPIRVLIATAALGLCMAASSAMAQDAGAAPASAGTTMGHMGQGTMHGMAPAAGPSRMGSMHQGMTHGHMAPASGSTSMHSMHHQGTMHKSMHNNNGSMHTMPATVTSVDARTGKVGVNAGGMALTVHFPPKSMASLKVGDKITLHLGYTQ